MWGFKIIRDKPQEDKPTTSITDFLGAKISSSRLKDRIEAVNSVKWGDEGKDSSAFMKWIMGVCYGLERQGRVSGKNIRALKNLIARYQSALEDGPRVQPLAETLEIELKALSFAYGAISLLPEDFKTDVALPPDNWINPNPYGRPMFFGNNRDAEDMSK